MRGLGCPGTMGLNGLGDYDYIDDSYLFSDDDLSSDYGFDGGSDYSYDSGGDYISELDPSFWAATTDWSAYDGGQISELDPSLWAPQYDFNNVDYIAEIDPNSWAQTTDLNNPDYIAPLDPDLFYSGPFGSINPDGSIKEIPLDQIYPADWFNADGSLAPLNASDYYATRSFSQMYGGDLTTPIAITAPDGAAIARSETQHIDLAPVSPAFSIPRASGGGPSGSGSGGGSSGGGSQQQQKPQPAPPPVTVQNIFGAGSPYAPGAAGGSLMPLPYGYGMPNAGGAAGSANPLAKLFSAGGNNWLILGGIGIAVVMMANAGGEKPKRSPRRQHLEASEPRRLSHG